MAPAALEDVCWLLPLLLVLIAALWGYQTYFQHASEALIWRWAEEHRLKLLALERVRVRWRNPPGVRAGKNSMLFRLVAKTADGSQVEGWAVVGTTPLSLKPNKIRVTFVDEHP